MLLDSLPTASYEGTGPATPGRRQGHITGAVSIPYPSLFDAASGLFLPPSDLKATFASAGLTQGVPVLAY